LHSQQHRALGQLRVTLVRARLLPLLLLLLLLVLLVLLVLVLLLLLLLTLLRGRAAVVQARNEGNGVRPATRAGAVYAHLEVADGRWERARRGKLVRSTRRLHLKEGARLELARG